MFEFHRLLAGGALAFALVAQSFAQAVDFNWPNHGTIRFEVPDGWKLNGRQAAEIGYAFKASPKSGASALLQITLAAKDGMDSTATSELPRILERTVHEYLDGSVEKKFAPQPLPLAQGAGYYVQLTDSSLVGKAPQKDNYKVMRNGIAVLDPGALVIITMQFDNADGPEVGDMMAIVRSMAFDRSKQGDATVAARVQPFVFTRPQSKLRVGFPKLNLKVEVEREGYFLGGITPEAINISGWLEPAHRYNGLEKFWAKESGGKITGTLGREGDWETVSYTTELTSTEFTQHHLRAELSRDGTWIDLHLSAVGKSNDTELSGRLLSVLRAIQISTK